MVRNCINHCHKVIKTPSSRKTKMYRVLFLLEIIVGIYYAFYLKAYDAGGLHITLATVFKDMAEV